MPTQMRYTALNSLYDTRWRRLQMLSSASWLSRLQNSLESLSRSHWPHHLLFSLHKWQPCCDSLPRMISSQLWNKWLQCPCYRWGTVHKQDAILAGGVFRELNKNLHSYLWLPCRVQWFCMAALHANRMDNDGSRRLCPMGTGVYRLHEVEYNPNPNRPENLS